MGELVEKRWNSRMAFDVALVLEGSGSLEDVRVEYGLSEAGLLRLTEDSIFERHVSDYRDTIRENGLSFKCKARVQAEELLETSYELIHDPSVSTSVKADLIKSVVRWAGYGGDGRLGLGVEGGSAPSIVINVNPVRVEVGGIGSGEGSSRKEIEVLDGS